MNTIKATWKNGQVVLDNNVDWPEGRRLVVREEPVAGMEFMTEDEQSDDPAAIQQWIDELRALPPLPLDPSQELERLAWQERMKTYNRNAVCDQMKEGAQ